MRCGYTKRWLRTRAGRLAAGRSGVMLAGAATRHRRLRQARLCAVAFVQNAQQRYPRRFEGDADPSAITHRLPPANSAAHGRRDSVRGGGWNAGCGAAACADGLSIAAVRFDTCACEGCADARA